MEFIKQGTMECWLASTAMVCGKTLEQVKADFEELVGTSYAAIMAWPVKKSSPVWNDARNTLESRYGFALPEEKKHGVTTCPSYGSPGQPNTKVKSTRLTKNKLNGRGVLAIRSDNMCHAVAFQDGMVYDPDCSGPLTYKAWRDYLRIHRGRTVIQWWRIVRVKCGQ